MVPWEGAGGNEEAVTVSFFFFFLVLRVPIMELICYFVVDF